LVHRLATHEYGVGAIRFSPDGNTVATGNGNTIIQLWDARTGNELRQLKGHRSPINGLSFAADGKKLASIGSWERTIRLWNVADGTECSPFARHQGEVNAIAYAPDGQILATASHDQTVGLWKTATGEKAGQLLGHTGKVNTVAYSPDGRLLASGSEDKTVRVWEAATGKELQRFHAPRHPIRSVAFSPDGRSLASGEGHDEGSGPTGARMPDCAATLWDVTTGKALRQLEAKAGRVDSVAFSPDGRILASAGPDGAMVHLWDPTMGKQLGKLESEPEGATPPTMAEGITRIAFSPDGRTLASVSRYRYQSNLRGLDAKTRAVRMIRLWEVVTGKERFQIKVPFRGSDRTRDASRNEIACLAFSRDGRSMVLGKADGAVSVWALPTAKETRVLAAHKDKVGAVAISPDGKTFATASWDTTALLWDGTSLLRPQRSKPTGLTMQERESLWTDLASPDASRAYRAIWAMAGEPRDCLPLVSERMKPVPKVDAGRIAQLTASLDDDNFKVREQATTELNMIGEAALPSLRQAMTVQVSVEARRRIERLLEKFGGPAPPPEVLQALRAVEMLEHEGSPEARQVLEAVSQGAPQARLTQDAKAALERLAKRAPGLP